MRVTSRDKVTRCWRRGSLTTWMFRASSSLAAFASAVLLVDTGIHQRHPSASLQCDITATVSCSREMDQWQSHVFGIPNPVFGVVVFGFLVLVSWLEATTAPIRRFLHCSAAACIAGSWISVQWFWYQSLFVIGVVCPWCVAVWLSVILMFWVVLPRHFCRYRTRIQTVRKPLPGCLCSYGWALGVAHACAVLITTYCEVLASQY